MKITDEMFRKVAEEVLKNKPYIKNYKINGLKIIPSIITNSKKGSWDAFIEFSRNGEIKEIVNVYPGAMVPINIAREIAQKLGTLK